MTTVNLTLDTDHLETLTALVNQATLQPAEPGHAVNLVELAAAIAAAADTVEPTGKLSEHLDHRIHAQWSDWVDAGQIAIDGDTIIHSTSTNILDESETVFWCQDCDLEVANDTGYDIETN